MKNNLFIGEIVLSIVIIILALALLNPFGLWMASMTAMTVMMFLVIAFALFVVFIWREKPRDEREAMHKMFSSRIAFSIGASILVLAIVVESLGHRMDGWLVIALVAMILAKVIGRAYTDLKH